MWLVDLADGEPLIGFASVATGNEDWLAKADEIMNSLALSEPLATQSSVENVFAQPAGSYTVECFSLGQLSLDLPAPADVLEVHPGVVVVDATGTGAGVVFMAPRQTAAGRAVVAGWQQLLAGLTPGRRPRVDHRDSMTEIPIGDGGATHDDTFARVFCSD